MKKEDLYSMYNELDDMISSIDIKDEDIVKDEEIVYIEEEPVVIVDDEDVIEIMEDIEIEEIIKNNNEEDLTVGLKLNDIKKIVEEPTNLEEKDIDDKIILDDENTKELVIDYIKDSKKAKKKEKKKSSKGWVITFSILDVIAFVCLFLMYGPISYFRNLWVTSAMTTMSHKYLAYIFFNEDTITHIMENNIVIEAENEGNTDLVNIDGKDTGVYSSIYEEQVLKRDEGNDLYKVIDIEGNGYKGHMLVVYDPSRVHLYQYSGLSNGGKKLEQLVELADAKAGINASGFSVDYSTYQYTVAGAVIIDGKVISDGTTGWGGGIIGFTNDNKLLLTKKSASEAVKMGVRDGMSFGPFLVVNGEPSTFKGNGGYGVAPRTAIGQRKDGIVLMLVIDGRRPGHSIGVDMAELTDIMVKYGAYNASNLDGGGSSSMVVEGEVISIAGGSGYSGERYLANGWVLK